MNPTQNYFTFKHDFSEKRQLILSLHYFHHDMAKVYEPPDRHFASPFSMHLENSLYKQNKYIKVTDSIKILIYIKTLFILTKARIKIDSSDRKYGGDSINCHKII